MRRVPKISGNNDWEKTKLRGRWWGSDFLAHGENFKHIEADLIDEGVPEIG